MPEHKPTLDEQQVAIKLRKIIDYADDTRSDGIWVIPAGGVMLREDGYQFTIEHGSDLDRYVVIVKKET